MEEESFKVGLFTNIWDKSFTGFWNGKPRTFKPGEKKYMPAYLAEHFAKHLANKMLEEMNTPDSIASMSPKKPEQTPLFIDLFSKACIIEEDQDEMSQLDMQIDLANRKVEQLKEKREGKASGKTPKEPKGVQEIPGDDHMDEDEPEVPDEDSDEEEFAGKKPKSVLKNDQSKPSSMLPDPKK